MTAVQGHNNANVCCCSFLPPLFFGPPLLLSPAAEAPVSSGAGGSAASECSACSLARTSLSHVRPSTVAGSTLTPAAEPAPPAPATGAT